MNLVPERRSLLEPVQVKLDRMDANHSSAKNEISVETNRDGETDD